MLKDTRILSPRQAAQYMGCSIELLRRLRRWGWLKSVQDVEYANVQKPYSKETFTKSRFYVWQLELLAWDYACSLSFYDIMVIRKVDQGAAALRGVPKRVVQIVRTAELFGWLISMLTLYAAKRQGQSILGFDIHLPFPPDPSTLPRIVKEISLGHATKPKGIFGLPERAIFGKKGAISWTWTNPEPSE